MVLIVRIYQEDEEHKISRNFNVFNMNPLVRTARAKGWDICGQKVESVLEVNWVWSRLSPSRLSLKRTKVK